MRREEADRVVAPVVRQPPVEQERLGHVLVHRQQLDGGDAQVLQVRDRGLVTQPGVGPAQLRRYAGMAHGEALDVHLVDHRVRIPVPGPVAVLPVERRVHDQAPWHVRRGVEGARGVRVAHVVAVHLGPERDRSADGPRVGVKEQLGRVAAQALRRVPGSADPVPVRLARPDSGHERMPDVGVVIPQRDLRFRAVLVEQAQGDAVGDAGGDREVRAHLAEVLAGRGAKRVDVAGHRLGGPGVRLSVRVRGDAGCGNRNGSLLSGHCGSLLLDREARLRRRGPRRGGAGSRRRSGRSSRSGGRRRHDQHDARCLARPGSPSGGGLVGPALGEGGS